jgi:hypothetical protein
VKFRIPLGFIPVFAILVVLALPSDGALTLASEGKSRYCIVLATNAPPADQYASQELQHYLEELSGAKLPICG